MGIHVLTRSKSTAMALGYTVCRDKDKVDSIIGVLLDTVTAFEGDGGVSACKFI